MMKKSVRWPVFGGAFCLALALSAVPVLAKDTVKVGYIGPLTGGNSAIGLGARNSADLAVRLQNADPKSKYQYELVALDDECKANIGVQVATKMAADAKILGAATHYCSAVALGTVDIYHRFKMPAIVWGAVEPKITYGNDYPEIFRTIGTQEYQNKVAAAFMRSQGYKKFAIIHDTTDYGKAHKEFFTQFITAGGAEVVGIFGVTAEQQDFTTELTKIKALNPEVLYFGGLTPLGVRIRSQMDKLGLKVQFEGTSGIKSDAYISGVGPALAEGTLSFLDGAPVEKLEGGKAFTQAYAQQGYAQPPEAMGIFAFASMKQIIDAIEKAGPSRKAIVKALQGLKEDDTLIGKVTYDKHGQNAIPLMTKYVVQDGKWTVWEDSEYASGKRSLIKVK
ncbi:MAG: branched-chain amino acid ABC transporter substrate-binding protein [Candidatus Accumulibacter sp.]|nr:branched-chain amino acid ABC transporter substrate-binding protein [Accumulibacter sp.]